MRAFPTGNEAVPPRSSPFLLLALCLSAISLGCPLLYLCIVFYYRQDFLQVWFCPARKYPRLSVLNLYEQQEAVISRWMSGIVRVPLVRPFVHEGSPVSRFKKKDAVTMTYPSPITTQPIQWSGQQLITTIVKRSTWVTNFGLIILLFPPQQRSRDPVGSAGQQKFSPKLIFQNLASLSWQYNILGENQAFGNTKGNGWRQCSG